MTKARDLSKLLSTANGKIAGANLDVSFENISDSKSGYIDTVNPTASLLYTSMTSVTNPMPPNGKLSKCTTDLILKWIEQKAKNN